MTREDPQMKLRLPPEMRDQLKEAAEANKRSMNAEIVSRLQDSFQVDASLPYGDLSDPQAFARVLVDAMALAQKSGVKMKILVGDDDEGASED